MNRKLKNTLGLVGLFLIILVLGGGYIYFFQSKSINEKTLTLNNLKALEQNTEELLAMLQDRMDKAAVIDSLLAARKYNIPKDISPIKFYNFVNSTISGFSKYTYMDVEYLESRTDREFFVHEYKITGAGEFQDLYQLVYSIEQSKELKKITNALINNFVTTDEKGKPLFHVTFTLTVWVYFSNNDRFAITDSKENDLTTGRIYDSFVPLIQNEIPPNVDMLLDVQGARLLALIPEGAFIADAASNTYLLWEGEQVYLGFLTKIDYEKNAVHFILNKGGIIEKVRLELEKERNK